MRTLPRFARDLISFSFYQMVFRTVFGRWPNRAEVQLLHEDASNRYFIHMPTIFRAVLNRFDLATHPTPFAVRLAAHDIRLAEYAGIKIAIDGAEPGIGRVIERGEYEPHMRAFFQGTLRPGMTMIDIGANIGFFSLLGAKLVGEKGRV